MKKPAMSRLFCFQNLLLFVFEGFDSVLQFADPGFHEVKHHEEENDQQTTYGRKNEFC
jgi:hypothetical protein